MDSSSGLDAWRTALVSVSLFLCAGLVSLPVSEAAPPPSYTKEHAIMIDPTVLDPPSWWYVPGITPSIYNSDPDSIRQPISGRSH
jgi:hypothetical protein